MRKLPPKLTLVYQGLLALDGSSSRRTGGVKISSHDMTGTRAPTERIVGPEVERRMSARALKQVWKSVRLLKLAGTPKLVALCSLVSSWRSSPGPRNRV